MKKTPLINYDGTRNDDIVLYNVLNKYEMWNSIPFTYSKKILELLENFMKTQLQQKTGNEDEYRNWNVENKKLIIQYESNILAVIDIMGYKPRTLKNWRESVKRLEAPIPPKRTTSLNY